MMSKRLRAVCGFVCSLMITFGSSLAFGQLPSARPSQLYYGEMDAGPRLFRFVLTTQLSTTGAWEAELKSLDEGEAKFKLVNVSLEAKSLKFELKQTKASYTGAIDDELTQANDGQPAFKGQWKQSGQDFDLNFTQCEVAPSDKPTEVWVGDMKAGLQTLKMQFRVYADRGSERVLVDSLSQKLGGFKASRKVTDDSVEFDVPSLRGKYNGQKTDDKNIAGKWSQGLPLELKLTRIDVPLKYQVNEVKRPQTPRPPFPYDIEEVTFENSAANIQLNGTLTLPQLDDRSKKLPVAVLVSGSGPQDRDETLLGHKPFWVLADYLTRRGLAVLRYDDRGVGKSTGDFGKATSHDFAEDAAAAVEFLKSHDRIDAKQIGLIGHSEGGLVAPLVAIKKPEVAWIVLMAGTGVNGEQILYSQGKLIVEAEGGTPEMTLRQRIVQEAAFAAMKKLAPGDDIDPTLEATVSQVIERAQQLDAAAGNKVEPVEPEVKEIIHSLVKANLQAMNTPWFRSFVSHEPGPVLEKVQCPVLAINGEKDTQVDPKLNLPKIEASLKAGGNKNFKILELPGLNHLFQTCKTGGVSEYESIDETLSPVALKTIGDWVSERIK